MCCLRFEWASENSFDSSVTARRIVAGSAFTNGMIEVLSSVDLGRESRMVSSRCQDAADDAGEATVAVLVRRSTTMLVVPAVVGGKRKVATSPTGSCDDCRLVPQVFVSFDSKSLAVRLRSCQAWVCTRSGSR